MNIKKMGLGNLLILMLILVRPPLLLSQDNLNLNLNLNFEQWPEDHKKKNLAQKLEFLKTQGYSKDKDGLLEIPSSLEGENFKLFYKDTGTDSPAIYLKGKGKRGEETHCLEFEIDLAKRSGYVASIHTKDYDCGVKAKGAGNFMLKVADQLAQYLDLTQLDIIDASMVMCEKNNKSSSLTGLHLMQKGSTWYQSKGYQPSDITPEDFKKLTDSLRKRDPKDTFQQAKDILRTEETKEVTKLALIQEWQKDFQKVAGISYQDMKKMRFFEWVRKKRLEDFPKENIEQALSIKRKIDALEAEILFVTMGLHELDHMEEILGEMSKEGKNPTLAEFYSEVWTKDCSPYEFFFQTLFPSQALSFKYGPWLENYTQFNDAAGYLVKTPLHRISVGGQELICRQK